MYFYFYDNITQSKKYESALASIETRLIELGVNGRIEKLSLFKNAKELIENAIKHGAHTVVAVGNDETFARVVNIVAPYDVTVGFIPLTDDSRFAHVLGIQGGTSACETLSKRLCETIDIARIEKEYFLGSLEAKAHGALQLECDDQYTLQTSDLSNTIRIFNLGSVVDNDQPQLSNAHDGKLEVIIAPSTAKTSLFRRQKQSSMTNSVFPCKRLRITSRGESVALVADGVSSFHTPCAIEIVPDGLKVIVGRERMIHATT